MKITVHEKNTEAFGSVDDMLSKEQQGVVLKAYKDALDEVLLYVKGALPEGYIPTQLSFGNPFYTSVGTEKPSAGRYDPDRFGPHLFNIFVDFIDGDSPKVAFRVDTVDPETGETRVIKNLVYRDPFLEDFLGMSKPAFILRSTDADKLADATRKAFRKTEAATDSSGLSINEEEFAKLVNAYAAAVEGKEIKPIRIEVVKKRPLKDDGTLVRFHYDAGDNGWSNAMTYALVYGDLHKNRDNDLLYILHDWQSGEKVTPEDIAEHEWELANDYIRPSEILAESKANESAGYRVSVNFTPEPPFGYGDQNFLFKGLDIVDEEFSFPSEKEAEDFARDCSNRMTARNRDLESDGLQDGEIRIYYTNKDYVDRMVRNAGKAYAALWQDYDPKNPPFPVLVARIGITKE